MVGKYYSQEKLNNVLEKIDKLSEQKSLQFINHDVEETLEGDQVEVKVKGVTPDGKISLSRKALLKD